MWRHVHLSVAAGQHALIFAEEGCGKSVLFKVLAGVWPHVQRLKLRMPDDVLCIPQHPILPRRCTLRAALCYPQPEDIFTDEAIVQALERVALQRLLNVKHVACSVEGEEEEEEEDEDEDDEDGEQVEDEDEDEDVKYSKGSRGSGDISEGDELPHGEGLDREDNWMLRTSPGMRQRLALAHALLQKPKLLFLDESTSSMSKSSTIKMYELLAESIPGGSIFSISHDVDTLADFHDIHYCALQQDDSRVLMLAKHSEPTNPPRLLDYAVVHQDGRWIEVLLLRRWPARALGFAVGLTLCAPSNGCW